MSFIKFIFTKTFWIQVVIAIGVLVVLVFCYLQWLNYSTNHDQRIEVPDLKRMSLTEVDALLEEHDLRRQILDSASFNPEYPPRSVIEQDPAPGLFVKENRKIYLKLNPSAYAAIELPAGLVNETRRQAESKLRALGFTIGKVTYKPSYAKDMVLEIRHKGEAIKSGDKLVKTSVIDLTLGDGEQNTP